MEKRKLGEQWVEIIYGQKHMVKEVSALSYGDCNGCFLFTVDGCGKVTDFAPCSSDTIIKDLGILNEDGCLPNCWGEYPRIEELVDVHIKEHWFRCITRNNVYCATDSYKTKQEAIDAWNWRV